MRRQYTSFLIVAIFILSAFGATSIPTTEQQQLEISKSFSLSPHEYSQEQEYLKIKLPEATSNLLETGKPILPVITKTFTFPLGTKISADVNIQTKEIKLDSKIMPSPAPNALNKEITSNPLTINKAIYESKELYPNSQFELIKKAGIYNNEHVTFLIIKCYTQYAPSLDLIYIPTEIHFKISYNKPSNQLSSSNEYDLLIITDEKFKTDIEPLAIHKNETGINTTIKTVQEIYSTYDGRDKPEDIKLAIKDAVEQWGITNVILAGGRKGQTFNWYIPSRRVNNDDGWESGYESDLYFADIYKINKETEEVEFEDWDSNKNNIFAEWSYDENERDNIDYSPDIYIGRIPFRYSSEVTPVVEKIIEFETNIDDSWFKKGLVIAGDTFPPSRGAYATLGIYEGELETSKTVNALESIDITVQKLWLSIPNVWNGPQDVNNAINAGVGFVHFAGHSNPASWANHPPDDENHVMIEGINIWTKSRLKNNDKYPIVMLGGCHSAQYNVTMANIFTDILKYGIGGYFLKRPYRFFYMEWVPQDICTSLILQKNAGAITCIGNSGLGYGYVNEHWDQGLGGWLDPHFFEVYANQTLNLKTIGSVHTQAINDYITIIGGVNSNGGQIDRKTIEQWTLLGDPSLQIRD